MKKIILGAIGLAMFATPLAAENAQSGIAYHERAKYGLDMDTPAVQVPVVLSQRFAVTPSGATQSFGLTLGTSHASSFALSPYSAGPRQDLRDRYGPIHR